MVKNKLFEQVIDNLEIGYWELDTKQSKSFWSSAFIKNLEYNNEDVEISLDYFLNNLIHKKDRNLFSNNFFNLVNHDLNFRQVIDILSANGHYKEYVCRTNDDLPVNIYGDSKVIFFYEKKYRTPDKVKKNNFYYLESAEMTSTGSWYVDFIKQKSYWDDQTRRILEYPEDYKPSLKNSSQYYAEEHHQLAADCFFKCAMAGTPFNTEIKMITANRRKFWAKAIGKAVYNDNDEIIGLRGVFQDIDDEKTKSIQLQKTSDIIASQNSRLYNFAHIVSHNLRSHSSNLSLITELIDDVDSIEEKLEFIGNIKDISESLNSTISHLNEIVSIKIKADQNDEVEVCFDTTINIVKKSIGSIIDQSNSKIHTDFSKALCIQYIPAYLESILLNLITNGIKYKHPDRDAIIHLKTYIEDEGTILEVSDNGLGIDLDKFGDKLFGMYKTFHYNEDAVGIGLFITKNQIESLNGKISVESEVNKGTTFKIQF